MSSLVVEMDLLLSRRLRLSNSCPSQASPVTVTVGGTWEEGVDAQKKNSNFFLKSHHRWDFNVRSHKRKQESKSVAAGIAWLCLLASVHAVATLCLCQAVLATSCFFTLHSGAIACGLVSRWKRSDDS